MNVDDDGRRFFHLPGDSCQNQLTSIRELTSRETWCDNSVCDELPGDIFIKMGDQSALSFTAIP